MRRSVGVLALRMLRWRVDGNLPDVSRLVVIVAPHTSNWDFVVGFSAYLALQLDATWFGKHTLFRWPMGPVLRHFGGIPVVRTKATNVVDLYVREFGRRERMVLALAPEGTRRKVEGWRTGFYHIAVGAGVPIVPVALDYAARRVRILPAFVPTGDLVHDLVQLQANFTPAMARHPAGY